MSALGLPAVATRGRTFAVARLPQVVGGSGFVVGAARWTTLAEAEKAAMTIDWRLQPFVFLVDRERE